VRGSSLTFDAYRLSIKSRSCILNVPVRCLGSAMPPLAKAPWLSSGEKQSDEAMLEFCGDRSDDDSESILCPRFKLN